MTRLANLAARRNAARKMRRVLFLAVATLAASAAACARDDREQTTAPTAKMSTISPESDAAQRENEDSLADASVGKWKVLAVGVNRYEDRRVRSLQYSEKDARDVADAFVKLGASEENVLVVDVPSKRAIERGCVEFFDALRPGDRAVVFFSGHGMQFENASGKNESFFVPNDCVFDDARSARETAVSIDRVMTQFEASRASFKWMIVDACRNDPTKSASLFGASKGLNLTSVPDSIVLLQSCKQGFFSYEGRGEINGKPIQNSLFTLSLLEALGSNAADADGNGAVSFSELFGYVVQATDARAKRQEGAPQRPYLLGNATDFQLFDGLEKSSAAKAKKLFEEAKKLADEKKFEQAREIMKEVEKLDSLNPVYASYAALLEELSKQPKLPKPNAAEIDEIGCEESSTNETNSQETDALNLFADAVVIPQSELKWRETEDGSGVYVYSVKDKKAVVGSVSIPQKIDGKNVVEIRWNAFEGCDKITSFTIPEGVKIVGENAFHGCSSLTSISIPASATDLGEHPYFIFNCFTPLQYVRVHSKNAKYASKDGVLFSKDMTKLLLYPQAKSNKEYVVPSSVQNIVQGAFADCSSLKSLVISTSVKTLDLHLCKLQTIKVDPQNPYFVAQKGILYTKDMKTLGRASNLSGKIIVPDGVETIANYAFHGLDQVAEIQLPSSVKHIGDSAFAACDKLTNVELQEGLETIGEGAFSYSKIPSLFLPGSIERIDRDAFYCGPQSLSFVKGSYAEKYLKELGLDVGKSNE